MTATFASAETVTITWPMQTASDAKATVEGDGAAFVTAKDVQFGASIKFNNKVRDIKLGELGETVVKGNGVVGNVAYPKTGEGTNSDFDMAFGFTIADSKNFKPTKISFYLSKDTSDGLNMMPSYNGSSLSSEVLSAEKIDALNVVKEYAYVELPTEPTVGENTLVFTLSSVKGTTSKAFVFSTVVIEGEVTASGEVDNRQPAPIAWPQDSYSANIGEAFDSPVLANAEGLAVTYESSNAGIATVSEDGVVTLAGEEGTAKITARYAGDADKYKPTNVSYEINVVRPSQIFIVDPILKVTNAGAVDAGTTILSDENITVVSELVTKGVAVNSTNICGVDFSNYVQVRAKLENGALVLDRTENSYMKITPNVNMEVAIYGRIQNNSAKVDNVNQPVFTKLKNCVMYGEDMSEMSSNGFYFGSWVSQDIKNGSEVVGKNPYAFILVAQTYSLEAGKTYYLSAASFGFQLYGIGYTAEAPAEVAAPAHDQEGETVKVEGSREVVFTPAAESHVIYTCFEAAAAPEAAVAVQAAAETVEHEGKTYTLAADNKVTVNKSGTLYYFAMDPATEVKSPVNSIAFDVTTGIADIDVDSENAPVEYFNMQGIRVANPQNGLYIRRQGNKVEKVYVK